MKLFTKGWARGLMLCAGLMTGTQVANAGLIGTYLHTYGAVDIDLRVYDGLPLGRYLWEYTVTNHGFGMLPGQNGFSGFELFLPAGIPEIGDITPNMSGPPATDWEVDGYSGSPIEWDRKNSLGLGIMAGFSGVFSFTTAPRVVATNDSGWYHTWISDSQTAIVGTPGMHVPWVPGLTPVPELSSTLALVGLGFLSLFGLRRKR